MFPKVMEMGPAAVPATPERRQSERPRIGLVSRVLAAPRHDATTHLEAPVGVRH
jgi:hypothetical protein